MRFPYTIHLPAYKDCLARLGMWPRSKNSTPRGMLLAVANLVCSCYKELCIARGARQVKERNPVLRINKQLVGGCTAGSAVQ